MECFGNQRAEVGGMVFFRDSVVVGDIGAVAAAPSRSFDAGCGSSHWSWEYQHSPRDLGGAWSQGEEGAVRLDWKVLLMVVSTYCSSFVTVLAVSASVGLSLSAICPEVQHRICQSRQLPAGC